MANNELIYTYTATTATTGGTTYPFGGYKLAPLERVDEANSKLLEKVQKLEDLFFRKVVSKCPACGQWGAAMTACKHCGHPIDLGEPLPI